MTDHADIDHTGLTGVGGGSSPVYDIERYTTGNVTVSSTTAGADLSGVADVAVAAAAGDLLMIGVSFRTETPNAGSSCRVDVKCITGSTENYVSALGTSPAGQGISGWFLAVGESNEASGEVPYVVQAADISGGNVTLSLRAWVSAAANWVIAATTNAPLLFWVRNLGQ